MHLELLLRGRRSTWRLWGLLGRAWSPLGPGCFCAGATFAWQAQHLESLGIARAGLVAAGARLLLRGTRSTLCIWSYFCVAGAAICASGATFAWQAQHLETLGIARARLVAAGARLLLRGRRSTLCIWSYFCVAGAALGDSGDC